MLLSKHLRPPAAAAPAVLATVAAGAVLAPPAAIVVAAVLALLGAVDAASRAGRRAARLTAAACVLALGLGPLLGGRGEPLALWAVCAVAIVVAAEVVGARFARLHRLAITDPLTGLPDRQGLWEAAERAIHRCRRTGLPLTLVHLDLDDFKAVNDSFGHAAGDRLLRECADSWTAAVRVEHTLARVGGDEFLLLLPGSDGSRAERVLELLRFRSPTGWSHGTAELRPEDDLERCLLRADAALYAAKSLRRTPRGRQADGRERCLTHPPELRSPLARRAHAR